MPSSELIRVALVQTKPAKGRYAENLATAGRAFVELADDRPQLVVFPESAFTGYFLEGAVYDLAQPAASFASDLAAEWSAANGTERVDLVAGFFENAGGTFYNSAMYLRVEGGAQRIVHLHRKLFLPTYGVFDEERFLSRGNAVGVFESVAGPTAIVICEDAWHAV
ncbi:MAG TPA: nitrilase-related carbon-nitrogen hydrolase, partial [Candidatus Tumulicola sp.]